MTKGQLKQIIREEYAKVVKSRTVAPSVKKEVPVKQLTVEGLKQLIRQVLKEGV